ncbi:MAG: SDR family NAD(P)-dependent oxidoreductase [Acidimicrobiales bacterium]
MAGRLEGKTALVTGAARGLGAAIATRFRDEGASIIINDLREDAAKATAAELNGTAIAADVSDSASVAEMFSQVAADHGGLDILVNNAGISGFEGDPDGAREYAQNTLALAAEIGSGQPVQSHLDHAVNVTDEQWRNMLAVHLDGTFFCCREALRLMGDQGSGAIINMGSIMGTSGGAGAAAYCAAKGGILGLTRSLAREVVTRNIRVNALAPGFIETDMTSAVGDVLPLIALQTPMGRLGVADDIAWAAVYLASDEAQFVTGQVLSPNGGWTMNQ